MQLTELFTTRLERATDPRRPVRPGTGGGVAAPMTIGNARVGTILVLGGTGKTGRRIVERLAARGLPVRVGRRAAAPPLDWENQATWGPALCGVESVYLTYDPDLAVPGGVEKVCLFAALAVELGVQRLVLLSRRGEAEARCAEEVVRGASAEWTILRSSWFCQNFSDGYLQDAVRGGEVVLPAGDVGEPFVDADDVADVAVTVLTEVGHTGQLYELTGPCPLTFAEAVEEIARAIGRKIRSVQVSREEYASTLKERGVASDLVGLLDSLFTTVLDGRDTHPTDGVRRVLGRPPRDFSTYARGAAAAGAWSRDRVEWLALR